MNKEDFLVTVARHLKENPGWLPETMEAANRAILERIFEDRVVSTSIQFSLSMLYDNQFGKLNDENQIKVLRGLMDCEVLEGTPFLKKIEKKLKKKLEKEKKN